MLNLTTLKDMFNLNDGMRKMSKVITKIEAQKKKENRVNIFINGEFAFGCSSELVYYHSLSKGKEVNIDELKEIITEDNYITGKAKALKYLETTLRTEHQIREYLEKREYEEEVIDRVIKFLKEYKFIDDGYYAKAYVTQHIKTQGKNNIKYKLMQRGIDEEIIVKTLDDIPGEDEYKSAFKLAERRCAVLCKNESDLWKIKNKLNTFLLSKGYGYEIIKSVIENLKITPLVKIEKEGEEDLDKQHCEEIIYGKELFSKEKALSQEEDEQRLEELYSLAEKRFHKLCRTESDKFKQKRKLQDFLLRKGYSYSEIKSVMNKLTDGIEEEY